MFINHLFSPFSISTSAVSLSLARPFMALLLKACLRVLSLRHYKTVQNHPFIVKMNPSPFFVLLNCNCSLNPEQPVYLQLQGLHHLGLQVSFNFQRGRNSFPALNRTFLLSWTWRVGERALPERAPITNWSEYKLGFVLDIVAFCYSFLDLVPQQWLL